MVLARVRSRFRRLMTNPHFAVMKAAGRLDVLRPVAEMVYRQPIRKIPPVSESLFPDLDVDRAVSDLRRDGLHLGLKLPKSIVDSLLQFGKTAHVYGNRDPNLGFRYDERAQVTEKMPRFFLRADFFNLAEECPAVRGMETDPKILAIAAKYLRSDPVLQGTNMWWSFAKEATAAERNQAAQLYHMDLDDYRFLKFFFYLTDVDADHGPHVIVRGTHNGKSLRHQLVYRRYNDEEIASAYGAENVVSIEGTAGTGFIEDTLCFHKGTTPTKGDRLVIQLEFGLRDYGVQNDLMDRSRLKKILS